MTTLTDAATLIESFQSESLTKRLSTLETVLSGKEITNNATLYSDNAIDVNLLEAALTIKQTAGQINVIVHAVGILVLLPIILEPGEVIQSASLGAGNTGKPFDLETDRRIAEFKFTRWRGGSESIRQNEFFKDFFYLAEYDTEKTRYLYVVDTTYPLKFLKSGRAILAGKSGIVSRNQTLRDAFLNKYGAEQFLRVRDYYHYLQSQQNGVRLVDINSISPDLASLFQLATNQIT